MEAASPLGRAALLLALATAGGCDGSPGEAASEGDPAGRTRNVLLITLDTTRADHLGCYGGPQGLTPEIDRLAAEGSRFERCIASASVTPVSHASILTGRQPYGHGLRVIHAPSGWRLSAGVPTLAGILTERGFDTAAILSSFTVSEHFGLERGFAHFDNGIGAPAAEALQIDGSGRATWDTARFQRRSDETTDRAIEWLDGRGAPFLLWVHYWDPHDLQVRPPRDVIERFVDDEARGDAELARRQAYRAEVHWVDSQVGRLLQALRVDGREDDTLVVLIADHGEGLGDHGWDGHRLLYQEQIHLPLIVRVPGAAPGVVADLVRSIDVLPTVLEVLGLPQPDGVEGRSLLGPIQGRADEPPRVAYADQLNAWDTNGAIAELRPTDDLLYCAMDRRWKLIHKPTQPEASELYDLEADPREERNLWSADHPEARRLLAELERRDPWVPEGFPPGEDGVVDPEAARALNALGYLEGEDG